VFRSGSYLLDQGDGQGLQPYKDVAQELAFASAGASGLVLAAGALGLRGLPENVSGGRLVLQARAVIIVTYHWR
jgi:hypothetical protein